MQVPIDLIQAAADALLSYSNLPDDVAKQLSGYLDNQWASSYVSCPPTPCPKWGPWTALPPWKWLLNHGCAHINNEHVSESISLYYAYKKERP